MPYLVEAPGSAGLIAGELATTGGRISPPASSFAIELPLARSLAAGESLELKFSVAAFVCNEGSNLCQVRSFVMSIPLHVKSGAAQRVPVAPRPKVQAASSSTTNANPGVPPQ